MKSLGNLIWLVFGGLPMALGWFVGGLLMYVSIIGIPFGRSCFEIGRFALWPFGSKAVDRDRVTGEEDLGTGAVGALGNILWFVFVGWWLALGHLSWAFGYFVTIIGIPFGWQHLKLAGLSLAPIGKTVVREEAV